MIITENLTVRYEDDCLALEDVSVHIEGPAIVGLLGPNGAGKSTFIKAILNLITYSGKIYIDGKKNSADKGQIAYVEQKSQIDYNFPMTVKECVSLGTYAKLGLFHRPSKAEWRKEFADRPIKALSGGQFQRMLIARCLVQAADYIFLDEPFVGIDSISETIITNLLRDLKKSGKTILIVHHDLSKARSYFDHLLMINKNLVAYGKVEDIFTEENLRATYGDNIFLGKES